MNFLPFDLKLVYQNRCRKLEALERNSEDKSHASSLGEFTRKLQLKVTP